MRAIIALAILSIVFLPLAPVSAAVLTSTSVALSDARPSQTGVQYSFTGSNVTTSSVKCVKLVFSTTAAGTTLPTAMSTSSAAVSASSNYVASLNTWTVDASTNGTVLITNATGATPASASGRTVILTGITNSSTVDTNLFAKVTTFDNVDCATTPRDSSTTAFIITTGQSVSTSVDPSISFTVAGTASATACNGATSNVTTQATSVPLGTVTSSTNQIGVQNLTVTTNAGNGYTVYTKYTGALTNGASNTITDHTGTNAAPTAFPAAGTAEAYGYTTNDAALGTGTASRFTSGGPKWAAFTTSNAEVAYSNAAASSDTTCVAHEVGITGTTEAGTYITTAVYTATPVY